MNPNITTGFFCMNDANVVAAMKDLAQAKQYAHTKIQEFVETHPKAKAANIEKARKIVDASGNINKLVMNIGSLVLAHPSEGLKVI